MGKKKLPMFSKLKIFLLSSVGLEMKYEMLSVDTMGQSSHIPEPALNQEEEGSEAEKAPGAGNALGCGKRQT